MVVPMAAGLSMSRVPPMAWTCCAISVRPCPEGFAPPVPLSCTSIARNSAVAGVGVLLTPVTVTVTADVGPVGCQNCAYSRDLGL